MIKKWWMIILVVCAIWCYSNSSIVIVKGLQTKDDKCSDNYNHNFLKSTSIESSKQHNCSVHFNIQNVIISCCCGCYYSYCYRYRSWCEQASTDLKETIKHRTRHSVMPENWLVNCDHNNQWRLRCTGYGLNPKATNIISTNRIT